MPKIRVGKIPIDFNLETGEIKQTFVKKHTLIYALNQIEVNAGYLQCMSVVTLHRADTSRFPRT